MQPRIVLACLSAAAVSTSAQTPPRPAVTLAIVNAAVWTGDAARPAAEAVAMAGDRIVAVGTTEEIRKRAGTAEVIDAGGQFLVPGFIDAHVHFTDGGFRLASVQLRDAKLREQFVARIAAFVKTVPAGTWIQGGDWDHTLWGGELPRRDWIDAATPSHPVWVNRLDGHMALANSAALRAAGLTRATKDVDGGEIVRDAIGVIPSMQPYHAIDDGRWAETVIGPERAKGTYAFRTLLDTRAALAFGSDWYVAPPTPLEGIYAAVTRRTLDDARPGGWVPEQKITVNEALRAYTWGAAYAGFDEKTRGTIAPGMLADLTLIDRDLRAVPAEQIRNATIARTIVGGRTVYAR